MTAHRALGAALLLAILVLPGVQATPTIAAQTPLPGEHVRTATPTVNVTFSDPDSPILTDAVLLIVDGEELQSEEYVLTETGLSYTRPSLFAFAEGNHTVLVRVRNEQGQSAELSLTFVVNLTVPPKEPLSLTVIVVGIAAGFVLLAGVATGAYFHARQTRAFTFRKHFLRHPGQLKFLVLYIPSGIAVTFTLGALAYASTLPDSPKYLVEEILVVGGALAFGPFGLSSARASVRTRACERAFAQFLFELADAVRGGINPVKAVQELAKTGEGILKRPLQQAADLLRLGRPMDEALRAMTASMGSPLVLRYGALVGEASSMGGSVAGVLQRAAKDMDDLVKIKGERRRALRQPVFTMYMAFGVLLLMILQIISFAPNIGDLDFTALGVGGDGSTTVAKMPILLMQERFFHLLLVNAAGAGLLVGFFTEGKARNGILHAIIMVGVAAVTYPLLTV